MNFRKVNENEIEIINSLYREGSNLLKERGIDQWQGVNLPVATKEAINNIFVLEDDEIIATTILLDYDSDYDEIFEGEWKSDGDYFAVHRFMTHPNKLNRGLTTVLFNKIEEYALSFDKSSLRIDTHKDNIPMQKAILKAGYEYCGIVYLYNGVPRLAYEKKLK